MNFITIQVSCPEILKDYLISELFEIGFDSFQELDNGFEGSCEAKEYKEEEIKYIFSQFPNLHYQVKEQEKINWNKEWEKNYDPIIINDKCIVRASFHEPNPEFDYEIIVTPKMSFGTGHHATTYQILAYQMELNHYKKKVLDVGTGTGILAIMAHKRGATTLVATDIDEWCIENSAENFELNDVSDYSLNKTEINELKESEFDIVIANINKNVLIDQMNEYAVRLKDSGELLISGFYYQDIPDLLDIASKNQLVKKSESVKDNWAMLVLSKQSI